MTNQIDELIVHTDGGSRGNPGPSAVGVVIKTVDGTVIESYGQYIGDTTNNQAEYRGVIHALTLIEKYAPKKVKFVLDSELVVKQINGIYKMKNADLKPLWQEIKDKTAGKDFIFTHVLRAENKLADAEVNKALDAL